MGIGRQNMFSAITHTSLLEVWKSAHCSNIWDASKRQNHKIQFFYLLNAFCMKWLLKWTKEKMMWKKCQALATNDDHTNHDTSHRCYFAARNQWLTDERTKRASLWNGYRKAAINVKNQWNIKINARDARPTSANNFLWTLLLRGNVCCAICDERDEHVHAYRSSLNKILISWDFYSFSNLKEKLSERKKKEKRRNIFHCRWVRVDVVFNPFEPR